MSSVLARIGDVRGRVDPPALRILLEELFRWNPRLGLVSKRDAPAVAVRLVVHSVRLWDFTCAALGEARLSGIARVADIGSGGGFPGLVWKMISPAREFLLIERKERKATFLERVIARAHLAGISVLAADLEEAARREDLAGGTDLAVMTAVADPAAVSAPIERILRTPGYFCTVRGRDQAVPPERIGRGLERLALQDVGEGRAVLYHRAAPRV